MCRCWLLFSRRVSFGTFVSHSSPSFASSLTKHLSLRGSLSPVPSFFCSIYGTCGTVWLNLTILNLVEVSVEGDLEDGCCTTVETAPQSLRLLSLPPLSKGQVRFAP